MLIAAMCHATGITRFVRPRVSLSSNSKCSRAEDPNVSWQETRDRFFKRNSVAQTRHETLLDRPRQ
jgi:hypothetical protein